LISTGRQGSGISDIVRVGHNADDLEHHFTSAEMEFTPGPTFPDDVLADFPLALAVNFDAGGDHNQAA
jgi:hypothetical protein